MSPLWARPLPRVKDFRGGCLPLGLPGIGAGPDSGMQTSDESSANDRAPAREAAGRAALHVPSYAEPGYMTQVPEGVPRGSRAEFYTARLFTALCAALKLEYGTTAEEMRMAAYERLGETFVDEEEKYYRYLLTQPAGERRQPLESLAPRICELEQRHPNLLDFFKNNGMRLLALFLSGGSEADVRYNTPLPSLSVGMAMVQILRAIPAKCIRSCRQPLIESSLGKWVNFLALYPRWAHVSEQLRGEAAFLVSQWKDCIMQGGGVDLWAEEDGEDKPMAVTVGVKSRNAEFHVTKGQIALDEEVGNRVREGISRIYEEPAGPRVR